MSDILEAELAPSGGLRTGWVDLGRNDLFRDAWVVLFYLGLMLPHAFIGYWIAKVALFEQGLDVAEFTLAIMLIKAPFVFVLIWAQPVERWTNLPLGRRRSWIIGGLAAHVVLLLPLFVLGAEASVLLIAGLLALALVPRLMAEAGVAGMMVESIPKLGRFNSGINLAYRGGGHVFLLLMGALVGAFGGEVALDLPKLWMTGLGVAFGTALLAMAITLVMKEGAPIRGPEVQAKPKAAKTLRAAIDDGSLDFPEAASTGEKLLAAMRTRTAWVVLFLCFLMPLGDGFEGMFALFLRDDLGFDVAKATLFANATIFANYLGLLGPWISDHIGRQRMLKLSARASIACYLGLALMMLGGVGALPILILWFPTLMVTDWLIFTFITTWAEVSDARLPVTHMAVYKTVHTVAANFVWFGLAAMIIVLTGGMFWLIFALACIGPLVGLMNFDKFRLGEDYGSDPIELGPRIRAVQDRLAGMPWGAPAVDAASRRRLAMSTGLVGLFLSAALIAGPIGFLKWDSSETRENWSLDQWNTTVITVESHNTISTGGNVLASLDVPSTEGGILFGHARVEYLGSTWPTDPTWRVDFSMPDRGNFSDGSNDSSFSKADWADQVEIDFDAEGPNLTDHPSEERLLVEMERISREMWWGHGRGTWTLRVELTGDGGVPLNQGEFRVNLSVTHLVMPLTNPDEGMVNVSSSTTVTHHDYGKAVGALLGTPVLFATCVGAYAALRDPEEFE